MTVVPPSGTMTVVLALCVVIGGMPLTRLAKSAALFWISMVMMIVPSAVIWGVARSSRAALTYRVVTVKLATVWTGIWRPWMISACWLFWVTTDGREMILPSPPVSRADRATSTRKVSRTLAKEKPRAVLKAGAGRLMA